MDRFFLQGYVPHLQSVGQVCRFLRWQRRFPIPSSAAFGKIGEGYVKDIHRFAADNEIPVVHFKKGESKEDFVRPLIDAAAAEGGDGKVVLIGIAQEKASVWRSWPSKGQEKAAHPHMEWGRQMAFVNHFYFYIWDREWGPAFIKSNAYAPWPIWIYLNGHEWAKRQCDKPGSRTSRSTTGSVPATTPKRCSGSATGWVRGRSTASFGGGPVSSRRRSPAPICATATCTTSRSASSKCPTPGSSTTPRRDGGSSRG